MNDFTTDRTEAMSDPVTGEILDQKDLAERLLAQAKEQGVSLVGPGGRLNQLTKNVLEAALEADVQDAVVPPDEAAAVLHPLARTGTGVPAR